MFFQHLFFIGSFFGRHFFDSVDGRQLIFVFSVLIDTIDFCDPQSQLLDRVSVLNGLFDQFLFIFELFHVTQIHLVTVSQVSVRTEILELMLFNSEFYRVAEPGFGRGLFIFVYFLDPVIIPGTVKGKFQLDGLNNYFLQIKSAHCIVFRSYFSYYLYGLIFRVMDEMILYRLVFRRILKALDP